MKLEAVQAVDNEDENVADEICDVAFNSITAEVVDQRARKEKQT